jgi:hypothetical protein
LPEFFRIQFSRSSSFEISRTDVPLSGGAIITASEVRSRNSSGSHRMSSVPCARGLHSFPFQLNLSSSVHSIAQINS